MHFSRPALLTFTLLALLSTLTLISAERFSEDCKQCLVTARIRQVPSCEGFTTTTTRTSMSPQEKSCQCGAANSDAWIQSCAKSDVCDNISISFLTSAYETINIACVSAGISSSSGATGGVMVSKTAVAGVAIAAAAFRILL